MYGQEPSKIGKLYQFIKTETGNNVRILAASR